MDSLQLTDRVSGTVGSVCLLATFILSRLDVAKLSEHERKNSGRSLPVIMRQPVFVVAALASMLSYGIMNLLMTSTPLAMRAHEHPFADAALVLQWHMIGMYGPSPFTASLIQRFGVLNVTLAGIAPLFICIVVALAGTDFLNFWLALFLLGLGWNLMYVEGSALLTECRTPAERGKSQAVNDSMVFATMAVSSAASGLLLSQSGWHAVNYGSVPFLMLATAATPWLMWQRGTTKQLAVQAASE